MRWPEDAEAWPLAEHSRIVDSKPHRWHVQDLGTGPALLLIHGAGGATQSWRRLAPLLAKHYRVICVDLPGQGFTRSGAQSRFGLTEMAEDMIALCKAEGIAPRAIVGHSAGAAIAMRMDQLGFETPQIIGLNAALGEFTGLAGWLFPAAAKLLAATPFAASAFSAGTSADRVERLLASTGSAIDHDGQRLYLQLVKDKTHVSATLFMMAQWDLKPLLRDLSVIKASVTLIVGDNDKTVPPETSERVSSKLRRSKVLHLNGLGHLAHEEAANEVFVAICNALNEKRRA